MPPLPLSSSPSSTMLVHPHPPPPPLHCLGRNRPFHSNVVLLCCRFCISSRHNLYLSFLGWDRIGPKLAISGFHLYLWKCPEREREREWIKAEQVEEAEVGAAVAEVDPPRQQRQLRSKKHYYKESKPTLAASLTTSATSSMSHGYSNICITLLHFLLSFSNWVFKILSRCGSYWTNLLDLPVSPSTNLLETCATLIC